MLTGKASLDFTVWYGKTQNMRKLSLVQFGNMVLSVQWGVYVDFFDGVGIELEVVVNPNHTYPYLVNYTSNGTKKFCRGTPNMFDSRPEARSAAIEKANEIYNLAQKKAKTNAS